MLISGADSTALITIIELKTTITKEFKIEIDKTALRTMFKYKVQKHIERTLKSTIK